MLRILLLFPTTHLLAGIELPGPLPSQQFENEELLFCDAESVDNSLSTTAYLNLANPASSVCVIKNNYIN